MGVAKCGSLLVLDDGRGYIRDGGVAKNNDILFTPFEYVGPKGNANNFGWSEPSSEI